MLENSGSQSVSPTTTSRSSQVPWELVSCLTLDLLNQKLRMERRDLYATAFQGIQGMLK